MGTSDGGKKGAEKIKRMYGADFYKRIGAEGGSRKVPKGFALNKELARRVGKVGGQISRRGKVKK